MEKITFGTKIRILRALHGWSQQELANRIGVARINISMYETDDQDPKATTIEKLEAAFGLALDAPAVEAAFSVLARDDVRADQVRLALAIIEGNHHER